MASRLGRGLAGLALAGALLASGRVYGEAGQNPIGGGIISPAGIIYTFKHTNYAGRRQRSSLAEEEERRTLENIGKGVLTFGSIGLLASFGYFALANRRKSGLKQ